MESKKNYGNPTMNLDIFASRATLNSTPMTLSGTIQKSFLLLLILVASASAGWATGNLPLLIGGGLGAFCIAMFTYFKPEASPITGPLYSICQGLAVGVISRIYAESMVKGLYSGIVPLSVLSTIVIFGVMLGLYGARIIKVTEQFRAVVSGAVMAIFILYLGTFFVGMIWPAIYSISIYSSGPIGIAFSIFVIGLAAFRLLLNFDFIEQGVAMKASKVMEWYGAFALIVTLAWIYLEILRLVMKLSGGRR